MRDETVLAMNRNQSRSQNAERIPARRRCRMRVGTGFVLPTVVLLVLGPMLLAGCAPKVTRIELQTFDAEGKPAHHYTEFTRATFKRLSDGRIELSLRSQQPSRVDPTQVITQVVHVQSFWQPRGGVTYWESTQVNARVTYAIRTPPTGIRYDGGAFVSYSIDRMTGEAVGRIESGDLLPRYRMGNAVVPFGPTRITGTFRATENPADVVTTHQMLQGEFTQPID